MNKTKKIYFLSAIVMILGCYVLNLSYSLFIQTEEKDIVTSTVPTITTDLSITSLNLEANKEYVINFCNEYNAEKYLVEAAKLLKRNKKIDIDIADCE